MRSGTTPTVPSTIDPVDFQERRRSVRHAHRQRAGAMSEATGRVADSTGNWVDSRAPAWARPYLRLARLDRPIGSWLLLLPCWWSAGLAGDRGARAGPNLWHVVLFFIGAFAMRGAGCTWNDIVDRDLDAKVERTRSRPIPSGQVSVHAAAAFLRGAGAGRARGAAAVQPLHHPGRHRFARRGRDLSVHEADHLLAADRARPRLLLGRADGLGRGLRPARSAGSICSMPARSPG